MTPSITMTLNRFLFTFTLLLPIVFGFHVKFHNKIARPMIMSRRSAVKTIGSIGSSHPWITVSSIKEDLLEATDEVLSTLADSISKYHYNSCFLVISSVYEQSAFQDVTNVLKSKIPELQTLIGSTTGCTIGPVAPWLEPIEVESRASMSLTLFSASAVNPFRYDDDEIRTLISDTCVVETIKSNSILTVIVAAESCKPLLANFVDAYSERSKSGNTIGFVASSVTALHLPKLFLSHSVNPQSPLVIEKYGSGVVGMCISLPSSSLPADQINLHTVIARSALPVGPVYRIAQRQGNEIISLVEESENVDSEEVPLVLLDKLIPLLSTEQSDTLKRELLLSVGKYNSSLALLVDYSCQKPSDFNPTEGSLIMPHISPTDTHVQFSVRDSNAARRGLLSTSINLKKYLDSCLSIPDNRLLGVLVLGSVERGSKVFRYSSWESGQVWRQLQSTNLAQQVPVFGLFSGGVVYSSIQTPAKLMESDAVYAVLSVGPAPLGLVDDGSIVDCEATTDVLTSLEAQIYSDINDNLIVEKKNSLSSHAVRVSTMEFTVPEKQPQPANTLESMYWDRDKDLDRQRERFPLNRALLQAKIAEKKYPKRDFLAVVKNRVNKDKPSFIISLNRNSLHSGRVRDDFSLIDMVTETLAVAAEKSVAGIGCHVDSSVFKGQFEDLSCFRTTTTYPVFCDDFLLFAYQLFRARECGADVVRLHAAATSSVDMNYLIKIAKTLNMTCLVTCASKPQLLNVLRNVVGLEAISVTSRNLRLWKLEPMKAAAILDDKEVIDALATYPDLVLCQEGFTCPEELLTVSSRTDCVLLSEELLSGTAPIDKKLFAESLEKWIN